MALSDREKLVLKQVYNGLRSYIENYGYSPTLQELYLTVGMSNKLVDPAIRFLTNVRLIQKEPRRWRGLSIIHRYCKCGEEITIANAVYNEKYGRTYVRHTCNLCYRDYWNDYRASNLESARQNNKRWRINKSKSINISARTCNI